MDFRQLLPEARTVELDELVRGLKWAERAPADRPYTIVNFVASADGRASFQGRSGALGDAGDRAMFHALRRTADAVLVGTVTLRTERYGRLVKDPQSRRARTDAGLAADPLAVIVTRSGQVPYTIPLFDEAETSVIVFGPAEAKSADVAARVEFAYLDPGQLTLVTVLRQLRAEHGVRSLLCEGGPTLFGALLQEGVVDELFLTLAPKLAGGGRGPAVSSGPELSEPAGLRLEWLLERDESLYLRYALH